MILIQCYYLVLNQMVLWNYFCFIFTLTLHYLLKWSSRQSPGTCRSDPWWCSHRHQWTRCWWSGARTWSWCLLTLRRNLVGSLHGWRGDRDQCRSSRGPWEGRGTDANHLTEFGNVAKNLVATVYIGAMKVYMVMSRAIGHSFEKRLGISLFYVLLK